MSDNAIKQAIQKLAGTHLKDEMHLITATVNSVDQQSRTAICTPIVGHSPTDIMAYFMAEVDDGWMLIPAIGSTVTIVFSTRNLPYIIQYSSISKAYLVTDNGIQFQGGEFGGLVIGNTLLLALNQLQTALSLPLTTIEQLINPNITHGS